MNLKNGRKTYLGHDVLGLADLVVQEHEPGAQDVGLLVELAVVERAFDVRNRILDESDTRSSDFWFW